MTAVSSACRRAVLEADPRLVEALYLCQVQAAAEALSGVYAVLNRRRAKVLLVRELVGAALVSLSLNSSSARAVVPASHNIDTPGLGSCRGGCVQRPRWAVLYEGGARMVPDVSL
eukprot:GHUV01035117.1.p2 GENE.GHUV01035117.1~~GHUV01035117.1.p2  ORF type:complete len:115 (-),score=22.67 GHUV01035117.1:985-1329(-)